MIFLADGSSQFKDSRIRLDGLAFSAVRVYRV